MNVLNMHHSETNTCEPTSALEIIEVSVYSFPTPFPWSVLPSSLKVTKSLTSVFLHSFLYFSVYYYHICCFSK